MGSPRGENRAAEWPLGLSVDAFRERSKGFYNLFKGERKADNLSLTGFPCSLDGLFHFLLDG